MRSRLQTFLFRVTGRSVVVPISSCVHYCGYRYGRGEFNPYENYVTGLARGDPVETVRRRLVEFLQFYRPTHFGEALGLELQRQYPLWWYPWERRPAAEAWLSRPEESPDVLTHFSAAGIALSLIEKEYGWLEGAFASIRAHGYLPERFGGFVRVRRLARADGTNAHLVLDGNHRIAVLAALGYAEVQVRYLRTRTLRETEVEAWPQVRNGRFTVSDAKRLFDVYFAGNSCARTTETPAPIVPAL